MNMGAIIYNFNIKGLDFEKFELIDPSPNIEKVQIRINKDKTPELEELIINFTLNGVFDHEKAIALSITRDKAEAIASRIAFENDCKIGGWSVSYALPDEKRGTELGIEVEETLSPKPNKSKKKILKETIFTRLRNEIAHPRGNLPKGNPLSKQTKKEIKINIHNFQEIVKKSLKLKLDI